MKGAALVRASVACWLLGLAGLPAAAQPLDPSERERVDAVFSSMGASTPGCALGVYRAGAIAYSRGYGMANLEHGIAITPKSVFDIGSTSKQFTAASILLLAQDGRLTLDDDVRKWVPELPAYSAPVTIRQLLHHTSGIRDYLTLMSLRGVNFDGVTTDRDALDLIVRQKELNFAPGSEHLYSNSGYFLLGEIVKRASGKSLREFAAERIFQPLGMTVTHFHDDHTMVVPLRATGYRARGNGYAVAMSGFEQTGDGAVHTTVEELLQWDRNFYEPKIGGRGLLEELHVRGVLTGGDTIAYARGLMIGQARGLRSVAHGGSWAGYRAELLRFPEQRTSVAVLCNLATSNPSVLAQRVAEVVLEADMKSATPPPSPANTPAAAPPVPTAPSTLRRADYTGTFYSPELDVTYTIRLSGDTLRIERPGAVVPPLVWRDVDVFSAGGVRLSFVRANGQVTAFTVGAGRVRNIQFERI